MTRTIIYLISAIVLLSLLFLFCWRHHVPQITEDLTNRSRIVLDEAGLSSVTIKKIDGLNVVLGGTASNAVVRERAVKLVSSLYGVRKVIDEMEGTQMGRAALSPSQFQFSAMADKSKVELTGMVRNAEMRASIVGAARRSFGQRRVIDNLEVVPSIPEAWTPLLRGTLEQLAEFSSGKLDVLGQRISLVGSVASLRRKTTAQEAFTALAGNAYTTRFDVAVLAPDREVIENCQSTINDRLAQTSIQFASGSATISVDSHPLLEGLANVLAGCEGVSVEIQGHTDSNGDEQGNLNLSQRRAQAVVQYLNEEGIDIAQLSARGYGESQPRADNTTRDGRARNRRIEFVIKGK